MQAHEITLYLTSWQIRMIKDNMPDLREKRFRKLTIKDLDRRHWVTYKIPSLEGFKTHDFNLYLSDEQIARVTESHGIKADISALSMNQELIESKSVVIA